MAHKNNISKKIHLVWPNNTECGSSVLTPLGIGYIASYMLERGFDVKIHDLTFSKLEISNERAIYGVSISTPLLRIAMSAINKIKKVNKNNIVVVGGPHATSVSEELIKNELIDYVVIGEGEETFFELCKNIFDNKSVKDVKGIYYKDNIGIHFSGKRVLIEDLDRLPFPRHEMFQLDKYLGYGSIRQMGIINSRGCSFNCEFCQPYLRNAFGKKIRFRSAKNVVDELEYLKKKYKAHIVVFNDDTLIPIHIKEICNEIIKRNLKILWRCQARANLDKHLLRLMKKAGCIGIAFGVESGSQKVLDTVDKKLKVEDVEKVFKDCKDVGLFTHAYIMVGNTNENMDDVNQTIRLLKRIKPFSISVSITTAYPGTHLFNRLKSEGKFPDKIEWAQMHHLKLDTLYMNTSGLSKEEVIEAKKKIINEFKKSRGRAGYILSYIKDFNTIKNIFFFAIKNPITIIKYFLTIISITKTGSALNYTNPGQSFYGKEH